MHQLIVFTLFLTSIYHSSHALNPDDILPCVYQPIAEIHCTGSQINDQVLQNVAKHLGTGEYRLLLIQNTHITSLPNNSFQAIIENIIIENNSQLKLIEQLAFRRSPATTDVIVRNNKMLSDTRVFDMARYLDPSDAITITGNAIKTVPANALLPPDQTKNRLRFIDLSGNLIESIGSNAFLGHTHLEKINLANNQISSLAIGAFNLTYTNYAPHPGSIPIFLANNKLTSKSFSNSLVFGTRENAIGLDLESNLLVDLPESVFKPLFTGFEPVELFLYDNVFTCDCAGYRWLIDGNFGEYVHGLYCSNLRASFEGLALRDIGCNLNPTTIAPPTTARPTSPTTAPPATTVTTTARPTSPVSSTPSPTTTRPTSLTSPVPTTTTARPSSASSSAPTTAPPTTARPTLVTSPPPTTTRPTSQTGPSSTASSPTTTRGTAGPSFY